MAEEHQDRPLREFRDRTATSRRAYDRASEVFPGGDTRQVTHYRPYPAFVKEAAGCRLTTVDGEDLVDFVNNYTQTVLGHAPPPVVEAVQDRFARGNGLAAPTDVATDLAMRLVERVPSLSKLRFCNSGTEATMNAIRAARAHTGRDAVLKARGGYHGSHDTASVWVTGPGPENPGVPQAVASTVETVPYNDTESLKQTFATRGEELSCFIVEPFMGAGGAIPADAAYLEAARDLTRDRDALLVFDEVISFRLALGGLQAKHGIDPDLTTLGKLIGGGLPIGAFGGRDDVMAQFHPEEGTLKHSGTFTANPATMAGGLATLEAFGADRIEHINELGATLRERLRDVAGSRRDVPVTVTGQGSIFQIHFTDGPVERTEDGTRHTEAAHRLFLELHNRGIFLTPRGMGNLSTPMTDAEVDAFVTAFEAAVEKV